MALAIDALVLLAYFALILSIGLSQRSKSGSMEGFALGDRQIAWWAVLASILAAEISAGTFFGAPGEGYAKHNFTYIQLIIGYLMARVVVSAVFIPAYYRHGVVSIYEFLGTRFGPLTHRLASGVFLVTRLLASGTRLWAPTVLLVADAGAALVGTRLDDAALDRMAEAVRAVCQPIDDKRGTVEYRVAMAGVLAKRVVAIAAGRARKKGSEKA